MARNLLVDNKAWKVYNNITSPFFTQKNENLPFYQLKINENFRFGPIIQVLSTFLS